MPARHRGALHRVHDQLPHPRATLWWGAAPGEDEAGETVAAADDPLPRCAALDRELRRRAARLRARLAAGRAAAAVARHRTLRAGRRGDDGRRPVRAADGDDRRRPARRPGPRPPGVHPRPLLSRTCRRAWSSSWCCRGTWSRRRRWSTSPTRSRQPHRCAGWRGCWPRSAPRPSPTGRSAWRWQHPPPSARELAAFARLGRLAARALPAGDGGPRERLQRWLAAAASGRADGETLPADDRARDGAHDGADDSADDSAATARIEDVLPGLEWGRAVATLASREWHATGGRDAAAAAGVVAVSPSPAGPLLSLVVLGAALLAGVWLVGVLDETAAAVAAGRRPRGVLLTPLRRAARLLVQQRVVTERPDAAAWRLAPALYAALAAAGLAVVPWSAARRAGRPAGGDRRMGGGGGAGGGGDLPPRLVAQRSSRRCSAATASSLSGCR